MPINRNLNQRNRAALYSLKRLYGGGPVSIYTQLGSEVNLDTGVRSIDKDVTVVQRVIILPSKVARQVVRSISQISANKAFVEGGYFDTETRMFIIDRNDAPGLSVRLDDWLVYEDRKFEIKDIQEFEFDAGYAIIARHQVGERPEQIFPRGCDHLLDMTVSATAIK